MRIETPLETAGRDVLERDLATLAAAWRPLGEGELPPRLVEGTLARLRGEALLSGARVRVDWRARTAVVIGVAAALTAALGLWQARDRLARPLSMAGGDWAEGLVLEERFASSGQELEIRLERVRHLLGEEESLPAAGAAALRDRLERMAEHMEAF